MYVDVWERTGGPCSWPATVLEGGGLVGSCPRLAPIIVIVTIFSGKFTLWVPGIVPHIRYSHELGFNSFKVH